MDILSGTECLKRNILISLFLRITISVFRRAARRFWPAGNPRFPAENPPPVFDPPRVAAGDLRAM